MSEHTQTPWERVAIRTGKWAGSIGIRPTCGGPAFAYFPPGRQDIQEANARLLLAAPKLLAVAEIEEAMSTFDPGRYALLRQHGWNQETTPNPLDFVETFRRAAIAAAKVPSAGPALRPSPNTLTNDQICEVLEARGEPVFESECGGAHP